jgi:dienelactone hydrolase
MSARIPVTSLLALLLSSTLATAETVRFRSATWPPTPLQMQLQKRGQTIAERASVEVTSELYRPPGNGPFPAVVLLHPCSGRLPAELEQADAVRFTAQGYALLAVDSFGARGIDGGCSGGGSSVDVVMDAYGALNRLASLPFIDANRIALVGYSNGATVTLMAVAFDGVERLFDHRFQAAIAYYPFCSGQSPEVSAPTLILMGERDEWTPARDCRALLARHKKLGGELRLVVYPEARHGFNLELEPRRSFGYPLEYDATASKAAWTESAAFLRRAFGR